LKENRDPSKFVVSFLMRQAQAVAKQAKASERHPGGEPVHRLRVALRRARTSIWVLSTQYPAHRFWKLDRTLRSLLHATGELRERDVLERDARARGLTLDSSKRDLKRARVRLRRKLTPKRRRRLRQRFEKSVRLASKIRWIDSTPRDQLSAELSHWLAIDYLKSPRLHSLRKLLKKTRYSLEALGQPTPDLESLQTLLGELHDLSVLESRAGSSARLRREMLCLRKQAARQGGPTLLRAFHLLNRR
jgi:CHAD domain-containing protein